MNYDELYNSIGFSEIVIFDAETLHCSIRSRSVSDLKTVSDAIVRTEDGRLLCELRGIEIRANDSRWRLL